MAQHTPGVHYQQQQQQIVSTQNQVQPQQLSAHQNSLNNNNNYPSPHSQASAPIFNSITPSNVYIPHQPTGAFYLSTPISSNVFVNNVTANVNVHGYVPHSLPTYIPNPPAFISGEVPQSLPHVAEHTSSSATSSISTTITKEVNISSNSRKPRGGRSRGGNRRNDYMHRQQQQQQQQQQQNQQILSPSPQDIVNSSIDNGNQAMGPGGSAGPTAAGYSHYYHPFGYFQFCGAPAPQNMIPPPGQQGGSPQLILNTLPMYQGPQMYPCPQFIYQPMMTDYALVDDKGEEQTTPEGIIPHMAWHTPMSMEFPPNEYIAQTMAGGDVNHNSSSLASSDTPSLLSPNYQIFDQQVHTSIEIQQQMSKLHIFDQAGGMHSQHISSEPQHQQQLPNTIYGENQQEQQNPAIICPQNISESGNESVYGIVDLTVPPQTAISMPMNLTTSLPENITKGNKGDIDSVNNKNKDNVSNSSNNDENNTGDNDNYETDNKNNNNNNNNNTYNNNVKVVTEVPFNTHLVDNVHDKNDFLIKSSKQMQSVTTTTAISRNHNQSDVNSNYESNKFVPISGKNDSNESVPNSQFTAVSEQSVEASDSFTELKGASSSTNQSSKSGSATTLANNQQQKKSVASVAVTATPSSTNKQNLNKALNVPSSSSYSTSSSNSMINYPTMKTTPFSPASTGSQDSFTEKSKLSSSIHQSQQSMESNKSTKSIGSTVVPQQLQENSRTHDDSRRGETQVEKSNNDSTQNAKKDTGVGTSVVANPNVIASNSPTQQSPPSWASLFSNRSSTITTTISSAVAATNASSPSLNTATVTKKPIAKVPPYEGTSNLSPSITTSTRMSYSAASAQGVSSMNSIFNKTKAKDSENMLGGSSNDYNKVGMDEWSLKLADFLTNYKVDYSPITLRPRGLTNRSNYCYINAILQAFIGCPPFYNLMKSIPKHSPAIYNEKSNIPTIIAMMQLVSEFSYVPPNTLKPLHRRTGEKGQKKDDFMGELSCDQAFEPTNIYKLWNASRADVEGRQEDAEEFLGYVLNKLNDEMLEVIKLIAPKSNEQNGNVNDGDDTEEWQMIYNNRNKGSVTRQTDFGRTPLSDIFRGELRSRIQREGEHSTDVIQPFFTLQLNIEKAASVKEALEILVGKDQLEGVTCSKTNQEVVAWQQMTLEKLPVVLILHLKWFDYKLEGCTKILKTVEFPIELKIDTKILASKKYSQKQRLYRLFAIVYHDGKEASKGHYVTDVYHTGYSNWIRYDDSSVKPVAENNVLRPRAPRVPYLLYYRRCDTVSQNQNQNKQNTQSNQRNSQQQQQQQHHHH